MRRPAPRARSVARRLLSILAVTGLAAFAMPMMPSASAAPSTPTSTNQAALEQIGSCIAGGGQGNMLLLVDRSGSLKQTDPGNTRVAGAQYLVNQMATYTSSPGGGKISVAVAGFDAVYAPSLEWTSLSNSTKKRVNTDIASYAKFNNGVDTDYWRAMRGAQQALNQHARSDGAAQNCSFIVLFTDGQYSVEPRQNLTDAQRSLVRDPKEYDVGGDLSSTGGANGAVKKGIEALCRPGGLADQVRTSGITTIAIGLQSDAEGGNSDFHVLQNLATGSRTDGSPCGSITSPAPGAFYQVQDLGSLLLAFDNVTSPGQTPIQQTTAVCTTTACKGNAHQFTLDAAVQSVRVLAVGPPNLSKLTLVGPNGQSVPNSMTSGSRSVSGATVTSQSGGPAGSYTIDLKRTAAAWNGTWQLKFFTTDNKGVARSSIHLYGDLFPSYAGPASVTSAATTLELGVTDSARSKVTDPATLADSRLSAFLVPQSGGDQIPLVQGVTGASLKSPVTVTGLSRAPIGPARLVLTLDVTTKGAGGKPGTALAPRSTSYPFTIAAPPGYPTLRSTVIDFGSTDSTSPRSQDVVLSRAGSPKGCAYLEPSSTRVVTTPDGLSTGDVALTSSSSARACAAKVPLKLKIARTGNGLVSGTATLILSNGSGGQQRIPVKFVLNVQNPASTGVLLGTLITVILLGILIPLALLYLAKFLTSKMPGAQVRVGSVTGVITDGESFLDSSEGPALQELETAFLDGHRRRLTVGEMTLVAKVGLLPTESGYVVVEQTGHPAAAGAAASQAGGQARLPLAVQGHWCVALDRNAPNTGPVKVTFFTGAGSPGWTELVDDARGNVRAVVDRLRSQVPSETGGPGDDGWGQGGTSAGDGWDTVAEVTADPWASGTPTPSNTASRGETAPPSRPHPPSVAPGSDHDSSGSDHDSW